jgi:AraC-like DNA-binding protein
MTNALLTNRGPLHLLPEFPKDWNGKMLAGAAPLSFVGDLGSIVIQELKTKYFLLRYFNCLFLNDIDLLTQTQQGLQSILSVKGSLNHTLPHLPSFNLQDGQFLLWNGNKGQASISLPADKKCQLVSTFYSPSFYKPWYRLFPNLDNLKEKLKRPVLLTSEPKTARTLVLDTIRSQFHEHFPLSLQQEYNEMKVRETLFTFLAQSNLEANTSLSLKEKQLAQKAFEIIQSNIAVHYSNADLAKLVHTNEADLKRIFKQQYGIGMFQLLQQLRFKKAKELLLQDLPIKYVAPLVGYPHTTSFITEFRKYFGYTPLDFQKRSGR